MGGKPVHTYAKLPAVNTQAPKFSLTGVDMKDQNLDAYKGKYLILNIFPSVDRAFALPRCVISMKMQQVFRIRSCFVFPKICLSHRKDFVAQKESKT